MADVELDVTFESSNVSLDTDFGTVYVIDGNTAVKVIANKYSSAHTYAIGDYVIYESLLYRCTTAIDEPEEFDSEKWLNIKLTDDVKSIKSALDTLSDVVDGKADSADVTSALANKMDKSNPTGSGSLSLNRKPGDIGSLSVTVGDGNTASGPTSFAAGRSTVANHRSQHVFGEFNTPDDSTVSSAGRGNYIEIIGNGTGIRARSNARTLDWQGNEMLAGDLTFNGDKSLTSEISRLDGRITDLPEAMVFKGTLGVGGTIETLPTASAENEGWTFKCITAGTYAGLTLKVGDSVTCFNPPNTSVYEWDISGYGDTDTDTWRSIKINGEEALGSGISSGSVDFVGSENVDVEFNSDGNKIGIKTKNIYTKEEVDDIVYNILPDDTASGSIANFATSLELPIKSLEVDVNAVQSAGTPTPTTPLPISGWSEVSIVHCGTNIWDEETLVGGYNISDGAFNPSLTGRLCSKNMIKVQPNSSVYWLALVGSTTGNIFYYDKDKNFISGETGRGNSVINIPNNCYYLNFTLPTAYGTTYLNNVSVNSVSTDTTYHAYNGNTTTINLGQTVYGGHFTQDKAGHRQFEVTYSELLDMGDLTWANFSPADNIFRANVPNCKSPADNTDRKNGFLCSIYPASSNISINANMTDKSLLRFGGYLVLRDTSYSDYTELASSLSGAKLIYELATPIIIDLPDGEPIITINGTNNIYADTGDTSVVFKNSVNGYVEKKIASVQALALNT